MAEHAVGEWQATIKALIFAKLGGPTMSARNGIMRALNRRASDIFSIDYRIAKFTCTLAMVEL